jgi:peptidoglycan-N-acetylglucosamine deacetylase
MGTEKASPVLTRRVLLTAGGLTLLGICVADPRRHVAAAARPAPTTEPSARPYLSGLHPTRPQSGRAQPDGTQSAGTQPGRTRRAARPQQDAARRGVRGADEMPVFTVDDGPKAIALTIDDGPNPIYTPQVLALLARYRVTATFSMIGIEAQAYPGVARDVAAAGHLIANHTWTHPDLALLPPAVVTEQMSRAADAIHAATGTVPDLFRAPYGAWSPFVLAQCARAGLTPLDWSVDPRDWSRPGVASIVANIMRNTRTGSIILEHDGGGDRSQTVAALKIVIPRLLAAGYHFRTP